MTNSHGVPARSHHLSVVMPVYNEGPSIHAALQAVCRVRLAPGMQREIIIVDDGSRDTTCHEIQRLLGEHPDWKDWVQLLRCPSNRGKGSALREGFKRATGEWILIQDGDLEYTPDDYPALLAPFSDSRIAAVYGSRFLEGRPSGMRLRSLVANRLLSWITQVLYGSKLTDEATGYKVFRREVLQGIPLERRRFEFCPEVTAKLLRSGHRIVEVPVRYRARSVREGKKIRMQDGFIALGCLFKFRNWKPESA